jgi:ubiquinone/menaquinone biosynthesis C-methylase UbiE
MPYKILTLNSKANLFIDQPGSNYWNDESEEKDKVFNVIAHGFDKIEKSPKYLDLLDSIKLLFKKYKIDIKGSSILSIAAGSCWMECQWLKDSNFEDLTCLDFSKHRIHKLAPFTIEHYDLPGEISLLHGSVFELDLSETKKYDIIFMSQAFHHFDEPIRLLKNMKQFLTYDGCIVIVGEHFYTVKEYHKRAVKHFIKCLINWNGYRELRNFYPSYQDLFPPCYEKGDIHWSPAEYDYIFKKSGMTNYHHDVHSSNRFQSFLIKNLENSA